VQQNVYPTVDCLLAPGKRVTGVKCVELPVLLYTSTSIVSIKRPYSSQIIFIPPVKNRTLGKNRISFVTRYEHICQSRFLCTMKSHSSQVKKCMIFLKYIFTTESHLAQIAIVSIADIV